MNCSNTYFQSLVAAILLVITMTAQATEIGAGRIYLGPSSVESSIYGISIQIPKGFRGALMGEIFVIESVQNPQGSIYITAMPASLADVQQTMASGFSLGQGIYLAPLSQPLIKGNEVSGNFRVQGADSASQAFVVAKVTASGNAIAFIGVYKSQVTNNFKTIVKTIADSTRASKPKSSGFWGQALAGRKLIYLYNGRGANYQERKEIVLCANGSFYQSGSSSGSSGSAISLGRSSADGRWLANGSQTSGTLYLQFSNGEESEYELNLQGESLYMNGSKYFYESTNC